VTEPDIERVESILVVGSGAMGSQIAMVCALAGYRVAVQDIDGAMLERAQDELRSRMARNGSSWNASRSYETRTPPTPRCRRPWSALAGSARRRWS
jgi:3-hydroxyacyl-CoA dehydrogenase